MHDITLPQFEGPLDLLLRLIERQELDVTAIALAEVADQYLAIVHAAPESTPLALAEFVRIGARLMYIKSRALLPAPVVEAADPGSFDDDPIARELVEQIIDFQAYRAMADSLAQRADAGLRAFPRLAPVPMVESGPGLQDVNLVTLRDLMHDVLARIDERPAPPQGVVARQLVSLAQRVEGLRARLRRDGRVSFRRVLMASATREDVVIAFLAVLELIRMGECEAVQDTAWGEIELTRPGMRAAG